MRDCGVGCPAALLSSLPVEKLEPILDMQQTHGRSSALAFSSATLALGSMIAAASSSSLFSSCSSTLNLR